MARLFVFLVATVAVLAVVEANSKKCSKNIDAFAACLEKGYKSEANCTSGDGVLSKKELRKCAKVENQLNACDYSCRKSEPEPEPQPEPEPEPQPEPEPEPQPEPEPEPQPEPAYDMNCARPGFDFGGADIRSFFASSLEECAMECSKEAGCKSITTRDSDNYCWLKNKKSGNGPSQKSGLTSMNLKCDRSDVDSSCKRDNFDFGGADLKSFFSQSLDDCANHCRDTEECQSFTLRKSDNYCWLKNKRGGGRGPYPKDGLVSMNIECFPGFDASDRTCAQDGFDFGGADLRDFKSSGYEECRTSCFDAIDCVSFTLKKSDNNCWMKTKEGGENGPGANDELISANMSC